jgi:alanine-glyoxylate transaminase/serine-glyoxylate transaminase/serine-pyruvate transaminase
MEQMMRTKLMIPGPVELEEDVLKWMGAPVQAHYGDAWVKVHNETIGLLKQVIGTSGKVFMLPGSGSLGNDAAVQSIFAPGDHVALGINGNFGKRMQEILQANGVVVVPVEMSPDQPLDPAAFEKALKSDPTIIGIVAIHLETSTSLLNPVKEIGQVARANNKLFMVDAVASLAGTPLLMDEWGIDVVTSASQKGLGAAPGLAIIAVGNRAWDVISKQGDRPRSWYLDLRRWQWYVENWGDWHPFPVTMPTSIILGLRASLQSLLKDGMAARFARYESLAARLRSGLKSLGLSLFVAEWLMAPVLTAVYSPTGVTSGQLVKDLEQEHHIKVTGGFGEYRDKVFRIGHMGGAIGEAEIDGLLMALRQFLVQREKQQA